MSIKHLEEIVKRRKSVRSYQPIPLKPDDKQKLITHISAVQQETGFFQTPIHIQLIERNIANHAEKLGTYGIIKGASSFLGVTCENNEMALEAVGYQLERIVLYAASFGLGTCWLGGTFNRSDFSAVLQPQSNEIFPIVSPIGYPAEKPSLTERMMRVGVKADARMSWNKLFFDEDFQHPLTVKASGKFAMPLELLRLAPSAVNAQPWRILRNASGFHFYEVTSKPFKAGAYDMHCIDMGIGACHFDLAVKELGISGIWVKDEPKECIVPKSFLYRFSWKYQ